MENVFNLGNAITLALAAIGMAVSWGTVTQRLKNVEDHKHCCDKRFESIENDHDGAIRDLRAEIKEINNSLHELIGMVKIFVSKDK